MSNNRQNPQPPIAGQPDPAQADKEKAELERRNKEDNEKKRSEAFYHGWQKHTHFNPSNDPWKHHNKDVNKANEQQDATLTAGEAASVKRKREPGIHSRSGFDDLHWDGKTVTFPGGKPSVNDLLNAMQFLASMGVGSCKLDWPNGEKVDLKMVEQLIEKASKLHPPQALHLGPNVQAAIRATAGKHGLMPNVANNGVVPAIYKRLLEGAEKTQARHDAYMGKALSSEETRKKYKDLATELNGTDKIPMDPAARATWAENKLNPANDPALDPAERLGRIHEQADKLSKRSARTEEAEAAIKAERDRYQAAIDAPGATDKDKKLAREGLERTEVARNELQAAIQSENRSIREEGNLWRDMNNQPGFQNVQGRVPPVNQANNVAPPPAPQQQQPPVPPVPQQQPPVPPVPQQQPPVPPVVPQQQPPVPPVPQQQPPVPPPPPAPQQQQPLVPPPAPQQQQPPVNQANNVAPPAQQPPAPQAPINQESVRQSLAATLARVEAVDNAMQQRLANEGNPPRNQNTPGMGN